MSQCSDNISQERSKEMYNVPETDIIMRKDQRLKIPNPRYEQVRWMLNCKNQEMQLCKTNNAIKSIKIKNDQSFYLPFIYRHADATYI